MKWEFLVTEYANSISREDLEENLDFFGYEGWELINVVKYTDKISRYIFKKKLKQKNE